ncbi:hypothetical protein [Leptobacterium sp. I13]|uniref:hypothetical protein n=1 Tax=Leptobacterium meishanense TaxID=3128904 RepID=UPI0030EE500B
MDKNDFTSLIQYPEKVTKEHVPYLEDVIKDYPFFQAARSIYLKALKNQNSHKYNEALKNTAAHTTDRTVLFDFITSEKFLQHEVANTIQTNQLKERSKTTGSKEKTTAQKIYLGTKKEADAVLDPHLFKKKEVIKEKSRTPEETLQVGKPITFKKNEKHPFIEWLRITETKLIQRNKKEQKKPIAPKNKKFELIDKFIETNPKIVPDKEATSNKNLAETHQIIPDELMTETLAKVYLEQKKYKKAIQAYKILSLKYPEKSGFFADQIRAIEKLQ